MVVQRKFNATSRAVRNTAKVKVSSFGFKVLKKLHHGASFTTFNGGVVKIGSLSVPQNLLAELRSWGLVEGTNDGRWNLSDAGRSFLRRSAGKSKAMAPKTTIGEGASSPYILQHHVRSVVSRQIDGNLKKLNINIAETPLGWLRRRRGKDGEFLISMDQFEAAERLRCDYEMGSLKKQLIANYDGIPISKGVRSATSGLMYNEHQLDAKRRYDRAVEYVGSGLSDSLVRLCCHLEGFEAAEKALGWPSRSMKLVVLMALDRLVEHYKKGERPTK